jgi:GDP-4-dehydro-6-deoxy-D-mannose reductase
VSKPLRSLLVTGASGFVGRHFIAAAIKRNFAITAVGRGEAPLWLPFAVRWITADLSERSGFAGLDREYWGVAHFANISIPADYRNDSIAAKSVAMTARLVEHLSSARLLFPSSCHVYASGSEIKNEESVTLPAGRYGQAKLAAEEVLLSAVNIDARVARPFNHIGRHMPHGLMLPSLVARIRDTKANKPIVMLGKNSVRDFLDVRDIVGAYLAILELDAPPYRTCNVCSGNPTSIGALAGRFVQLAGKDNPVIFEEQAQSADDTDILVGDPTRLLAMTDWSPHFSLDDSVQSLLHS